MDSLLANYASSDDEEENPAQSSIPSSKPISSSSIFASIPQPKSSSSSAKSSLFSALPHPKTLAPSQPVGKKVVQFKPPINPNYAKSADFDDEDDEDEEDKIKKQRKESESLSQTPNVKSFLSSIPAPRNSSTLGVLSSAAGSGRRAIVDTEAPSPHLGSEKYNSKEDSRIDGSASASYEPISDQNGGNYAEYGGYSSYELGNNQELTHNVAIGDYGSGYGSYEGYTGYENYGDYGQNGGSWSSESSVVSEIPFKRQGKRGRNEIPTEIIEVKQDELTKDRPREDQVKVTGIAFGPAYQPAASTKGKPTKLHKRKHQIGSLYFDMKQKETELAERRAKGFLTKAQTQAKYGW